MCHPGSVVAVAGFALFVGLHLCQRFIIGLRVVFDWNLRRHAAHRVSAAPMTGFDRQQRIGAHKMGRHRHQSAIRQHKIGLMREFLDAAKDIIPAPAI